MTLLAKLIASEEGFGKPNTLPTRRHNPGDLRHSPHSEHPGGPAHADDIGAIDTDEHGWQDEERQLRIDADRGLTLAETIYQWAPQKDHNDPGKYLSDVLAGFHARGHAVTGDMPLAQVLLIAG
ncbi:MAG TPA: hypothetical protein VFO27_04800 [Bryobacteraceae bacterium]|nr:hypothetical protein [Bryobacteraceae bacterium]